MNCTCVESCLHFQDGSKMNERRDTHMRDSIPEELRDRQREVHDYMLEQAERDYNRKTQSQVRVPKKGPSCTENLQI